MTFVVYSKNKCPACVKLKTYLNNNNIEYKEVNVDEQPAAKEFLILNKHKSVPQVYKDGVHVPDPFKL